MISLPEEFKSRMKNDLQDEYDSFLSCYEHEPFQGLRVNTLKLSPKKLFDIFPYAKWQVPWCDTGFYYDGSFGKHPCHRIGLFYSQEPSAMVAAELLDVKEGDIVLDLCAAPGGKSTQIAAKLNGKGLLVANEIVTSRSLILRENIERMGIKNAVVTNMAPEKMEDEFPLFFDKILVDAPCSGEGMFRKEEEAVRAWSIQHTLSCAARQMNILDSAAKMLCPGGTMVYSTCTFSKEENDNNIAAFLDAHDDFELIEKHTLYPHKIDGEGHFAAKLRKKGSSERIERKPILKELNSPLFREFEKEALNLHLPGKIIAFGENLYLLPASFGDLSNIKAALPGLHLGLLKKNRFEPSHHLCLALKKDDFKLTYEADDEEIETYFQGGVIEKELTNGWGAILWHSYPVGWFKSANGVLKNHYPKKLRG